MPAIDRDLAAALKLALKNPMRFALVLKGPGEGTLVVSKKAIPVGVVAQAKKELGGGLVVRGRCRGEDGRLVFETAKEPGPNLAKTLKAVIRRDAGMALQVDARRASDLPDEDDAEEAPAPPTDPAAARAKADVARRLAALAGPFRVATNSDDEDSRRLKEMLERVRALVAREDWAAAARGLDELEALLDDLPNDEDLAREARRRGVADGEAGGGRRAGKLVGTDLEDYIDHYDAGFEEGKRARLKKALATRRIQPGADAGEAELQAAYDLGFREGDRDPNPRSRSRLARNAALLAAYDVGFHDGELRRWRRSGEAAPLAD